jgi:adenylate cyclase
VQLQPVERKLSAILSADIAGYSRHMEEDEEGTHRALRSHREVVDAIVAFHRGRIFSEAGDGFVAEFSSAVEALRCAEEIQEAIAARNIAVPEPQRMRFRIGVNLGDVMVEGDNLFGDGVNVAARLQALAEPGEIFLSGTVYDQIEGKLSGVFENLGEHTVKNIARPIRVYRMRPDKRALPGRTRRKRWPLLKIGAGVAAALLLVLGLGLAWRLLSPTLSDKPVIAVLPFSNQSGDSTQDYFVDGITEDMIAALGRFSNLSVIGRKAVFERKGSSADLATLSRELGARYIVEGSVRREGNVVRVTVELNDTTRGLHLWSDRFDGKLEDVFIMQDTITRQIVGHLAVELTRLERERVASKPTENLAAYDYVLRGYDLWFRGSRTTNHQAGEMFEKAIALDPRYGDAYVGLGLVYANAVSWGWSEFVKDDLVRAESLARQALGLDDYNAAAHRLLAQVMLLRLEYEQGLAEADRAIELNPSDWESRSLRGDALEWSGRAEEAIDEYKKALDFNAGIASTPYGITNLGYCYYLIHDYPEAIKIFQKALLAQSDFSAYAGLAAAHAQLGQTKEAEAAAAMVRRLWPFFEATSFVRTWRDAKDREYLLEGLRKAGLP